VEKEGVLKDGWIAIYYLIDLFIFGNEGVGRKIQM